MRADEDGGVSRSPIDELCSAGDLGPIVGAARRDYLGAATESARVGISARGDDQHAAAQYREVYRAAARFHDFRTGKDRRATGVAEHTLLATAADYCGECNSVSLNYLKPVTRNYSAARNSIDIVFTPAGDCRVDR